MDAEEARDFIRDNHHAVLATARSDGRAQMSPIDCVIDADGLVVISSRETAIKVKNLRRDPHAALCVVTDGFYGSWVQVEGTAEIVSLPEAMDGLIEYYRSAAGEHPDWDDYRAAMERDRRVLIRIAIDRAGPNASG
ncbi:MAG: PPOX class F420-dependent oxidoreductase [Acidimicrobiia bacterium]|nr:PPOX class F420-dependent oxidoreductase [Acidimicrobiia bacterium]